MSALAAHGLRVDLPRRWEARLYRRDRPSRTLFAHGAAYGHPDESINPVLHLANFALPSGRGDYGTGAVEAMQAEHAFVSLVEFDRSEAHRPLFAAQGMPRPDVHDFAPNALQRRLPGQLGCQRFFTLNDRAFCLYVVLGSRQHAPALVEEVHDVTGRVQVDRTAAIA